MLVSGWRCAVCGAESPIDTLFPWRCRGADAGGHHVLHAVGWNRPVALRGAADAPAYRDDPNPFIAWDEAFAWAAFAEAHGMDRSARARLVRDVDARIAAVAGTGFHRTPVRRADALSDALGFSAAGGVWVNDETHHVAGSQKARHLMSILLHLRAAEELGLTPWRDAGDRPPLAISSCGNAAIAASTLAAAVDWPITVSVPPWASETVLGTLDGLGAAVQVCPRRDTDPAGDPCIWRFRENVAAGAIPFGVQGTENALCLDGGRTLGWDLVHAAPFDRVFVQVGGGAFAACMGAALASAEPVPRLMAVQAHGCAPLAGAWRRAQALPGGPADAAGHWDDCMRVWGSQGEALPASAADGILDDETYDWVAIVDALAATGGDVVVAPERDVVEAHRLGVSSTGIDATATGTAGLAGVIAMRDRLGDDERVAVVFSGVQRG